MKRIKLSDIIHSIITENMMFINGNDNFECMKTYRIVKFIGQNYRRRKYHIKGYCCNNCGNLIKPNKICSCEM